MGGDQGAGDLDVVAMGRREQRGPPARVAGIEHLVQTMPLGGCGAFSLLTVVFPDLIRNLYELCERGDYAGAKALQFQASQLLLTIKQFKMHSATKAMMEMQGRPLGLPRQPNLPLGPGEREALLARLTEIGVWPTRAYAEAA